MEFYELNIWKKGYELLLEVYQLTATYPKEEKYNLISQSRSSANSIIAQIAEACGRYSFADKIRVLYQSRGESEETRSHLRVAYGLKYINKEMFEHLDSEYRGLGAGINSYIKSLSKYKKH